MRGVFGPSSQQGIFANYIPVPPAAGENCPGFVVGPETNRRVQTLAFNTMHFYNQTV